jgi:uncharacterized membrane-anchored protein YitT (DUF2179 family)
VSAPPLGHEFSKRICFLSLVLSSGGRYVPTSYLRTVVLYDPGDVLHEKIKKEKGTTYFKSLKHVINNAINNRQGRAATYTVSQNRTTYKGASIYISVSYFRILVCWGAF